MSDSTSDSPKPSDRFDNSETKIRNRKTCVEPGVTVSSVVYKAAGVDRRYKNLFSIVFPKPCDRLDNVQNYSLFGSGFLIDHALNAAYMLSGKSITNYF